MATLPALKLWTAGDQPDATGFQAVSDALKFLLSPPEAYAWSSVAQTLTSGSWNPIVFNSERRDTDGIWVVGTPTAFTIATPGWYEFEYGCWFDTSADTTYRILDLNVNGLPSNWMEGQTTYGNGGQTMMIRGCYDMFLGIGDIVQLVAWHNKGSNLNAKAGTLSGSHTFLHGTWTSF